MTTWSKSVLVPNSKEAVMAAPVYILAEDTNDGQFAGAQR